MFISTRRLGAKVVVILMMIDRGEPSHSYSVPIFYLHKRGKLITS